MQLLALLCLMQVPAQAAEVKSEVPAQSSRPRLQLEFAGGHGFAWGTMHAVPGGGTPIGGATRFQNYGTVSEASAEFYLLVADVNLRIGEMFRVGLRASNVPFLFDKMGEALVRVSVEPPPGVPLRYDGAHWSLVPSLWLGGGYGAASLASDWNWAWRSGLAMQVTGGLEVRWKHAFLLAEVGYGAVLSWRQDMSGDSESSPVRFSSPSYNDSIRVGLSVGARFQAF